jgi:hypothetical protein
MMQTFWIEVPPNDDVDKVVSESAIIQNDASDHQHEEFLGRVIKDNTGTHTEFPDDISHQSTKIKRLIEWNVQILAKLLKDIVSYRKETEIETGGKVNAWLEGAYTFEKRPVQEIQDYIKLPPIEEEAKTRGTITLKESVSAQLHDYVTNIALL